MNSYTVDPIVVCHLIKLFLLNYSNHNFSVHRVSTIPWEYQKATHKDSDNNIHHYQNPSLINLHFQNKKFYLPRKNILIIKISEIFWKE